MVAGGTRGECRPWVRATSARASCPATTTTLGSSSDPEAVDPRSTCWRSSPATDGGARARDRNGTDRGTARGQWDPGRRDRRFRGDARQAPRQARRRLRSSSPLGDMSTTRVDGEVRGRLPRLQHHQQPHDAGRPGRVFRERRGAPRERGGRFVIEVGVPEPPAAPARADRSILFSGRRGRGSALTSTRSRRHSASSSQHYYVHGQRHRGKPGGSSDTSGPPSSTSWRASPA